MGSLTVTEAALAYLFKAIETAQKQTDDNACYRFTVASDGDPQLSVDWPESSDSSFQYEGRTVLVVEQGLAETYQGCTLDLNAAGDFVLS